MMNRTKMQGYLRLFENEVIIPGVETRLLCNSEMISVRRGKLAITLYGRIIGSTVDSPLVFGIDYYGHLKRSTGFYDLVKSTRKSGQQIKMIEAMVVHFAALKIDQINRLTQNTEVLAWYPSFKNALLDLRGFRREKKRWLSCP